MRPCPGGPGSLQYDVQDADGNWREGDVVFDESIVGIGEDGRPIPTVANQPDIDFILDPDYGEVPGLLDPRYDDYEHPEVGMAAVIKAIPSLS
jgi:hypothetical protein